MVGDELLSFVKKNSSLTKTELAQATGYVSKKKDGAQRCNFTAMQDALVQAVGINIGGSVSPSRGVGGRKLSYVAKVQGNGNLLVGKAYTAVLGLDVDSAFTIKLNQKDNSIRLIPVGSEDDTED
jgi:hypothetical protein